MAQTEQKNQNVKKQFEDLQSLLERAMALQTSMVLFEWDDETLAPKGAAEHTARVIGSLSEQYQEILASMRFKELLDVCQKYDKGIFVLAKTSNPSSGELQDRKIDGKSVYEIMGEMCEKWGEQQIGKYGYSAVGAVVGATYPEQLAELRAKLPHTMFLVPGYGAQGGGAKGVAGAFDANGRGAIVNSSRAIMCAYQKEENCPEEDFAKAARREAIRMRDDIMAYLQK